MEVAIMIEGQHDINWPRWQRMARAVEDLGFVGLYRSDHFTNPTTPNYDSLELWVSLTWLASHTSRIEFGPLVSPVSFRDPVFTARMGMQIDDLSGGRLSLGVGAGWQTREHEMFGYHLGTVAERFARFAEGLEVISGLLNSEAPVTFKGKYYQLKEAHLLPRPQRPGGPPILIGGNGPKRTLPLVAKYAHEWNAVYLTADEFATRNALLDELLDAENRDPASVRRSMMTGLLFGRDEQALNTRLTEAGRTLEEITGRGMLAGVPAALVQQIGILEEAGVQRVMLQWMDTDDIDGLEAFAQGVLPQVH